jgi:hypothetical protein
VQSAAMLRGGSLANKRQMTNEILAQEDRVRFNWPYASTEVGINGATYPVVTGPNEVPTSVADGVQRKLERLKEKNARVQLLKIGKRRDGRQMLTVDEVNHYNRMINSSGVNSANDEQRHRQQMAEAYEQAKLRFRD